MGHIKNVRKYNMSTGEVTNLLSIIPDPEDIIFEKKSGKNLATIIDEIDGSLVGKTDIGHKHDVSDISDFPTNISFFNNDAGYLVMDDITSMNHDHDNKDVLDYLNWQYLADLEDKYTRQELEEKFENETGIMMTRFAVKNHQHRIEDITNYTPPATHLSQLENDTNFITNDQAQSLIDSVIGSGSIGGGSGHTHNNLNILNTITNQLIGELKDKYTKSETDTKIDTVKNNVYTKNESDILLSGKSDEDHTHNAWDLNWEGYNIADHTHKMSDITNLETTLNNKAGLIHNHSIANITDLQDILNLKAPLNHTHAINTIDGYQYFDNYDFLKTLTEDILNDINWNIESLEYKIECGNMDRVYWCGTSTGTNDYVVSNVYEVPDGISLKEGLTIRFKVGVTNTSTSCTIKLNDHDKATIKNIDGENPAIGALKEGTIYQFTYTVNNNISSFILLDKNVTQSSSSGGGATGITKVSELTNDAGYITSSEVGTAIGNYTYDKATIDNKITDAGGTDISKVSELENDTGFITSTEASTIVSNYTYDKSNIDTKIINNKVTKVSQLENDSNFITSSNVDLAISDYTYDKATVDDIKSEVENIALDRVFWCGTSTGTNDYTITPINDKYSHYSLKEGVVLRFKAGAANTSTDCTITVGSSSTNIPIRNTFGDKLDVGDIVKNVIYDAKYNGSVFLIAIVNKKISQVSELDNDSNFISQSDISDYTYDKTTIDDKITNAVNNSKISKTSQLTNDSDFITSDYTYDKDVIDTKITNNKVTKVSQLTNDSRFINTTQANSIVSNYTYNKSSIDTKITNNKVTKVSQLTNDLDFITSNYTYDKATIDDKIANSTNSSGSIEDLKIVNDTGTAAGTIVISTIDSMYDNYRKTFIAANDNNGSSTTVNGLPLYKEGTTEPPIIKAGRTYTVRYSESGNCFFVLAASSEGTATPAQVLAGYTFSNENDIGLEGTINNLSGNSMGSPEENAFTISKSLVTGTAYNAYVGAFDIIIPKGYYDGVSSSRIHIPNLLPQNIIQGSKIGWDGNYIDGTIPNRGVAQYTDNVVQADGYVAMRKIPWGYYPENTTNDWAPEICVNNSTLASAIGLTADKLIKGVNLLGIAGTANSAYYIDNIVTNDCPKGWKLLVGKHIWSDIRIYTATGFNFTPSGAILYSVVKSNYSYKFTVFINDNNPRFVMLESAHEDATEITLVDNPNYLHCSYGSITIPASSVSESYADHYHCIIF